MPDIVTHIYYANLIRKTIDNKLINNNKRIYSLGAQGPDFFYYYSFKRFKSDSLANKIAVKIHGEKTKLYLETLIKNAITDADYVYVLGFLTHYLLDSGAHPYIFYKTGLFDKKTKKNRGTHLELERSIDLFVLEKLGYSPYKTNVYKEFIVDKAPESIIELQTKTIKEVYDIESAAIIKKAFRNFKFVCKKYSYDPWGWKRTILSFIDKITHGSMKYRNISYYKLNKKPVDYLNLQKKPWFHPVTNEKSELSFWEIITNNIEKGTNLLKSAFNYFRTKNTHVFQCIENLDYSTGLPVGFGKMKYFDEIL